MPTARLALFSGSLLGFSGVALGALGAHALKAQLLPEQLSAYETAVHYQLFHALLLMLLGLLAMRTDSPSIRAAVWCVLLGVICFSGSIYGLLAGGPRLLGPVTPLGGLLLLAGWALLARYAWQFRG